MNAMTPEEKLKAAGAKVTRLEPTRRAALEPAVRPLRELLNPADLADEPARPYVIKGLIGQGDHAIIMGQPGSGKSVIAPHLAYAVAQGRTVLGRRVKAGRVLYIPAEDAHGMKGRVRALMARHGNAPNFYLFPASVDLTNPADVAEIRHHIETIQPVLVVIDTTARAFPGLRENEAEDMSRVVQLTREFAGICNSAVVNVHHVAKDAGTTPRGHGSFNGDADVTMLVEGSGSAVRSIKLGKNRSGPSDPTFAFEIEVEELGIDEDGDPITAPVAAEADPSAAGPGKEARLKDADAVMLRDAQALIAEHGEHATPEPGMPLVRAVRRERLRDHLIKRGWFAEGMLSAASDGSLKLTRAAYSPENRALTTLKRKGFLCFTREWVWLL
jgi:hypothetical protein